ncbi:MAG: hypothetical protein ACLFQK_02865 [Fibrobacterota bacterium]
MISGCGTYWPEESKKFVPEFGIDAFLVSGKSIDSVWVRLSYDILEAQPDSAPVYDSVFITVSGNGFTDTLISKDSLPNCFYSEDTSNIIMPGETYELYAEIYKAGVDTVSGTAKTTVPDTFSCLTLVPAWAVEPDRTEEFRNKNYQDISIIDSTDGSLNYLLLNIPGAGVTDTLHYIYDDSLWLYSLALFIFYPEDFGLPSSELSQFGIAPPIPPGNSARGIMLEYEWGKGQENWEDLEFVMRKGFIGNSYDSTGYFRSSFLMLPRIFKNNRQDLSFLFTDFSIIKYKGPSALNIYAVDEAAHDFFVTRENEAPVSNINGLNGVFGSASVFRVPFYLEADKNLITNGESKAIEESRENE